MPALDTEAGVDSVNPSIDVRKKEDDWEAHDYHQPSDEVRPDWNLDGAAQDTDLLFAVGYRVANADTLPEWKPGNEFKAKRDAMMKSGGS